MRTASGEESRFYRALCWQKLGENAKVTQIFEHLVENSRQRMQHHAGVSFFAKFGEAATSQQAQQCAAHRAVGLGLLGQGHAAEAQAECRRAVQLDQNRVWARFYATHRLP